MEILPGKCAIGVFVKRVLSAGVVLAILVTVACSGSTSETDKADPASADAGGIQFAAVGKAVQLNGSGSSGSGITYHWTLRSKPDGSVARLTDFESANPMFLADQPGSYVAQLIVMDKAKGTSKDFTIVNVAPITVGTTVDDHAGLKDNCQSCHDGVSATGKPVNHIESTDQCVTCHSTDAWQPNIAIDHNEILGTCSVCHNGIRAPGKPADHIATTAECNLCHNPGTTFTFTIMPVDILVDDEHPPIGDAMCVDCHNNVIEEGKPDDHIPASDSCENCHVTTDWEDVAGGSSDDDDDGVGASDHPPIGDLMCIDCHNNVIEEGKEDDHILTTDNCEACHNTNDWEPVVTVDHTEVIGECSSCHDNDIAQGKPPGHIETTEECNACHGTNAWSPLSSGGGGAGVGTVDHSGFTMATVCMDCHNGSIATGKPAGHIITSSDCDACHTTTAW